MSRSWVAPLLLALASCAPPPAAPVPGGQGTIVSASSPIGLSPDGATLWVVNPDADSVTPLDTRTLKAGAPLPVGDEPWAVAVSASGAVLVMNRAGGSLSILEGGARTDVPLGSEPGGLALSPGGDRAYVTLAGDDEVVVVGVADKAVTERIGVGRLPWAVAVVAERAAGPGHERGDWPGDDVLVVIGHRLARLVPGGDEGHDEHEGWLTVLSGGRVGEVSLPAHGFGFPNVVESLTVVGEALYLGHLLTSPALPNGFTSLVTGGVSAVSLDELAELPERRLDLNAPGFSTPSSFPRALAAAPDGETLYVVLAGSDTVMGIDVRDPTAPRVLGYWPTGDNPRGMAVSADGRRGYVMNYLSRDVSVLDLADIAVRPESARIPVVAETLAPAVLRGKRLFNAANDPRLSLGGWLSCASCHIDGGVDGVTWVLSEGPRQTLPLWSLAGTAPFHAAATRDELQDAEKDIEELMRGFGLAPGAARELLGAPNAGRSADLDALAAFLLEGVRVPAAPRTRDAAAVQRGRELFEERGCHHCHGGPAWTRSSLPGPPGTLAPNGEEVVLAALHDVGTYDQLADLTGALGFDAPTLLGLHATAPYFHSGSAPTLREVLLHRDHSGPDLLEREIGDLIAFLLSIDSGTPPFQGE